MAGIDDVKRSLVDWCSVAAERAAETARVASRRYDQFALGREIERRYAELGSIVYAGVKAGRQDVLAEPRIAELVAVLTALERERALKEEEISGIRQESAGRHGPRGEASGAPGPETTGSAAANTGGQRPDISD